MILSALKSRYSLHKTHSNMCKPTHRLGFPKEHISSYCIFTYGFCFFNPGDLALDLLSVRSRISFK